MPVQRPGAVTAASVLAIIYGSLFTLCGLCGLISMAAQGGMNPFGGKDPAQQQLEKQMQEAIERDVPAYKTISAAGTIIGLAIALAMLVGGITLLSMRAGARIVVNTASVIGIILAAFQAFYLVAFVMPAMNNAFQVILPAAMRQGGQAAPPQMAQAMQTMQALMTVVTVVTAVVYGLVIVYLIIILVLLSRPHVSAAFAAAGRPPIDQERRPGDERYEDGQEWGQGAGGPEERWR